MIVIGVGVLVVSRSQLDQALGDIRRDIQVAVDQSNWPAAQTAIEQAVTALGNDQAGKDRFDRYLLELQSGIDSNMDAVEAALESGNLDNAERLLGATHDENNALSLWDTERLGRAYQLGERLELARFERGRPLNDWLWPFSESSPAMTLLVRWTPRLPHQVLPLSASTVNWSAGAWI